MDTETIVPSATALAMRMRSPYRRPVPYSNLKLCAGT
jgi:hypothetical protein